MKLKSLVGLILFSYLLQAETLTIYNNLILKWPIKEIKENFKKENPNIKIRVLNAPLKVLIKKIITLKKADILIAGSDKFIKKNPSLFSKEYVTIGKNIPIIVHRKNESYTLDDFEKKRVVLEYKNTTSIGNVAYEILTNYKNSNFADKIFNKAIKVKNSHDLLNKIIYKEADTGINWKGAIYWPHKEYKVLDYKEVEPNLYEPRNVTAIITSYSKNEKLAKKFLDFLLTPSSQQILRKWGF